MAIAFTLSAQDGDGYYFQEAPTEIFCPVCDSVLDKNYIPKVVEIHKRGLDISSTYENRLIVTGRFKMFCEQYQFQGIEFLKVNNHPVLYTLEINNIIEFDVVRRKTRFGDKCNHCGNYRSIVGATPAYLKNSATVEPLKFYKTDIEFGTGRGKTPVIIIGIAIQKRFASSDLVGVEYKPVQE